MSQYLLDSDTITLAQFGHPLVVSHLASHRDTDIVLPVVSFQEQIRGWLGRLRRLTNIKQMADWYDRLVDRIFPLWRQYAMMSFTETAALRFDHLRSLRLNIGMLDLRIAAIALENGHTVVTRNQRDFGRVPGLVTVDWSV